MDLNKEIITSSEKPLSFSKLVFCFNFSNENEVWNFPSKTIESFIRHKDTTYKNTIGVWKIKQLKKIKL